MSRDILAPSVIEAQVNRVLARVGAAHRLGRIQTVASVETRLDGTETTLPLLPTLPAPTTEADARATAAYTDALARELRAELGPLFSVTTDTALLAPRGAPKQFAQVMQTPVTTLCVKRHNPPALARAVNTSILYKLAGGVLAAALVWCWLRLYAWTQAAS